MAWKIQNHENDFIVQRFIENLNCLYVYLIWWSVCVRVYLFVSFFSCIHEQRTRFLRVAANKYRNKLVRFNQADAVVASKGSLRTPTSAPLMIYAAADYPD